MTIRITKKALNTMGTILIIVLLIGGSFALGRVFLGGASADDGAKLVKSAPGYKEFTIVMQNNRYNPPEITVNQGDSVVLNLVNRDSVAHGVDLPQFGASIPGGHLLPGRTARMEFIATRKGRSDAATCGGGPFRQTDDHGEELIVNVI